MDAANARDAADLAKTKKEATSDQPADDFSALTVSSIDAANARLISTNFQQEDYLGGAHGFTIIEHWNYWLDAGRDVTAADIFLPDSNWKAVLTREILRVLNQPGKDKSMLWSGDELRQGVGKGLDPKRWTPTRDLLYVTFQEYDIAAYAAGSSTVSISWDHLRGVVQPGLHPETLPDAAKDTH